MNASEKRIERLRAAIEGRDKRATLKVLGELTEAEGQLPEVKALIAGAGWMA